jgi:hypothetical protein
MQTELNAESADFILEPRALIAVGLNGDIVVLQVGDGNVYLSQDAAKSSSYLAHCLVLSTEKTHIKSGTYEFKGYSAVEISAANKACVLHREACSKVAC